MTGDFSVEVLTESNECILGKNPSFNYLALAYEKVNSKDVNTRSIICERQVQNQTVGYALCQLEIPLPLIYAYKLRAVT